MSNTVTASTQSGLRQKKSAKRRKMADNNDARVATTGDAAHQDVQAGGRPPQSIDLAS